MPKNLDRFLFAASGSLLVLGLTFGAGLYSGASRNGIYNAAAKLTDTLSLVLDERENLVPGGDPVRYLQPALRPGDGVTVNTRPDNGDLIFLSGFFDGTTELRLIRRDGTVVVKWPVHFSQDFPDTSHLVRVPQTDRNVDLHGALVNPDGSVVFNYEYAGMVKLSRCGEPVWQLPHPTHHSVEKAESGGYWVPGRQYLAPGDDRFPPFTSRTDGGTYEDDLILKVSEQGEILLGKSIPEILYENGLSTLMTATGSNFLRDSSWDRELVHANKIGELSVEIAAAFPDFEAGDLVLSLREYNLLFVVDPDDWRIKWHQTGPWARQHDPEFNADGTITVFNNNAYRLELNENGQVDPGADKDSNILRTDPRTGVTQVAYGDAPGQMMSSVIRGKHDPRPGGGFVITEFEGGRVFETDAEGEIIWEYINRYDEDRVVEITEARIYPESYFLISDWSCP
ncbi:MAG: hypothetical protein KDA50_00630 [Rhodobacteraceae bacterium]|nr:hypothetical protein [Paracoccaceae bacterium]